MNLREWVNSVMNEAARKYYEIIFLQGEEADEPLKILKDKGEEEALEFLKQWDYGKEMEHSPMEAPWGADDDNFESDEYVMSWNSRLGYIGLVRKVEEEPEIKEPAPEAPAPAPTKPPTEEKKPEAGEKSEGIKPMGVPEKHQLKIALDTLKLNKVGAMVMGGMNHKEAVAFLRKVGYSDEKIKSILKFNQHSDAEIKEMMGG
jgi:hypothetical protein